MMDTKLHLPNLMDIPEVTSNSSKSHRSTRSIWRKDHAPRVFALCGTAARYCEGLEGRHMKSEMFRFRRVITRRGWKVVI